MHTPFRRTLTLGKGGIILAALAGLQACSSPYERLAPDPQFGQTVRAALQGQVLPTARSTLPEGMPYVELEQGLDKHRNAKPDTGGGVSPSGQSPSGLLGQ